MYAYGGTFCTPVFNLLCRRFFYRRECVKRIPEALAAGCGTDAPGSFTAWLNRQVPMLAFVMPGKRYDVGNVESYREVCKVFEVTSSSESMNP